MSNALSTSFTLGPLSLYAYDNERSKKSMPREFRQRDTFCKKLFKSSSQKFRVDVSLVCEKFLIFRLKILELSLIK